MALTTDPTPATTTLTATAKKDNQASMLLLSSSSSPNTTSLSTALVLKGSSKPCECPTKPQPPSTSTTLRTNAVTVHPARKPSRLSKYNHELEPIWEEPEDFSYHARTTADKINNGFKDTDERKVSNGSINNNINDRSNSRSSSQGSHLAFATSTGQRLTQRPAASKPSLWRRILPF
ncbi:hypothetical protein PV08_00637 [Exophiala spinifera]|uniref:Uncharacterized protein n=1 Tax=Exophiala spinifera TaxID=91928 RepID=A0A0D2A5M6_9EURO|nr:uncharacterized protein PV08_00637 [Exophiala spinifera]KIW20062.1 hypothetical protein PV08_00637 [Exophiala spinifera]